MRRICIAVVLIAFSASLFASSNPVPFVSQPLIPGTVAPGSPGFTLTVNGTGFVPGAIAKWNSRKLVTTFVSQERLTAVIPESLVAFAGTSSVIVLNPGPGGGVSNPALFTVTFPSPSPATLHPSSVGVGAVPVDVIAADFNNDGKADLAVITECGTNPSCPAFVSDPDISILIGNGDGTFITKSLLVSGGEPVSAVVGDFNHDGKLDLAVISEPNCQGCAFVSIYLGNGDGTFADGVNVIPGIDGDLNGIVAGDFNRDGKLDMAVAVVSFDIPNVAIFLNDGNGKFTTSWLTYPQIPLSPDALAVGDFNGDGILDLAVLDISSSSQPILQILLGNGDGTFLSTSDAPGGASPTVWNPPITMATGDFNGDGILDLAFVDQSGSLDVLLGNGDGTFTERSSRPAPGTPSTVTAADVNGDGILDLVVVGGGSVAAYLGNGDGSFRAPINLNAGHAPAGGPGVADFSGSGQIEVAVSNAKDSTVSVLLRNQQPTSVSVTSSDNPAFVTEPITFTATVSGQSGTPTGTVTFKLGSEILGTAAMSGRKATLATAFETSGNKTIQAFYSGDAKHHPSVTTYPEVVVKGPTTTTVASSQNPSQAGQTVTFTATVNSLSGAPADGNEVTFKDGGSVLGTGTLTRGVATFSTSSLSLGQHNIRAVFNGDVALSSSLSADLKQVVED